MFFEKTKINGKEAEDGHLKKLITYLGRFVLVSSLTPIVL